MTEDDTFNALKKSTWRELSNALDERWKTGRTRLGGGRPSWTNWVEESEQVMKNHNWTREEYLEELNKRQTN